MKKILAVLLVLLLCLTGCVGGNSEPTLEPAAPAVTIPKDQELPESVVTPDEMPSDPQDTVEVPAQPQPTIITE